MNVLGIQLTKSPFSGWQWEGDGGHLFRAAQPTPKSRYRLYAVLSPNVFHWIMNYETLTECVRASESIENDGNMLSKYFYE
jgi:hypothetical protein